MVKRNVLLAFLLLLGVFFMSACGQSQEADAEQQINEEQQEQTQEDQQEEQNHSKDDQVEAGDHEDGIAEETSVEPEEALEEEPGFTSPYHFEYPDAVRGIYVTGHSAGGSRFETLLELIQQTDLNAMVIDIKDDHGYLTFRPEDEEHVLYPYSKRYIKDLHELLSMLEKHEIYPIARIVVFKDSVIAQEKPEWSYLENGNVWKNGRGESFVNPFLQEVWDYNLEYARLAAEAGFKEIQFDYVRFPEGFEKKDRTLKYSMGDYEPLEVKDEEGNVIGEDLVQPRVDSVTDFVAYAKEQLQEYNVDVSVDIFGYTATLPEAPGIGQNFSKISEHVDVISSMIYPSHWGPYYFGIPKPDVEPYRLVQEYAKVENEKLAELENPPISRPWIQDFTASWLGSGNYIKYGPKEVEDQIRALNEAGIWEFLLWNANNRYTAGANYLPIGTIEEYEQKMAEQQKAAEEEAKQEEENSK